jgi:hypothetical protein
MENKTIVHRIFISLFLLFALSSLSFAQYTIANSSGSIPDKFSGTLLVTKSGPTNASITDMITISIEIKNTGSASAKAYVVEYLGNVVPVDPLPILSNISNESMLAAAPPRLEWDVDLPAGGSASVNYKVKPKTVGPLSFGPTQVFVSGGKFYSNSLQIDVICTASASCDESAGETPLTCPTKCGLGANVTPPSAPELAEIPTPEYKPLVDPLNVPLDPEKAGGITNMMILIAVIILAIIAGAVYFLFLRKK